VVLAFFTFYFQLLYIAILLYIKLFSKTFTIRLDCIYKIIFYHLTKQSISYKIYPIFKNVDADGCVRRIFQRAVHFGESTVSSAALLPLRSAFRNKVRRKAALRLSSGGIFIAIRVEPWSLCFIPVFGDGAFYFSINLFFGGIYNG